MSKSDLCRTLDDLDRVRLGRISHPKTVIGKDYSASLGGRVDIAIRGCGKVPTRFGEGNSMGQKLNSLDVLDASEVSRIAKATTDVEGQIDRIRRPRQLGGRRGIDRVQTEQQLRCFDLIDCF